MNREQSVPEEVRAVIEQELQRINAGRKERDAAHPLETSSILPGGVFDRSAPMIPTGYGWHAVEEVEPGKWKLQLYGPNGDAYGEQVYYYLTREGEDYFEGWDDPDRVLQRLREDFERGQQPRGFINGDPMTW
jgi:hypothetical protein